MGPTGRAIGALAETMSGGAKVASNKALLKLLDGSDMRAWFVDALRELIRYEGLTFAERDLISRVTSRALDLIVRKVKKETETG